MTPPALPEAASPQPKNLRFWPTILALLFVYPFGLYLLWRSNGFTRNGKIFATCGFGLLFFVVQADIRKNPAVATKPEVSSKPKYFPHGAKVVVVKGGEICGDAQTWDEFLKAKEAHNETAMNLASDKIEANRKIVQADTVFVVSESWGQGKRYLVERTTEDGKKEVRDVAGRDVVPYVSPEEKARLEAAQLADARAKVENLARKALGSKVISIDVWRNLNDKLQPLYTVALHFEGNEALSSKWTKRGIEMQMRDAYAALYAAIPDLENAKCFANMKLSDKFGNKGMVVVYMTNMNAVTAHRIQWAMKDGLDFTQLWETTKIHPVLLNE